ncbi:MAG: hypothetical protein K2H72_08635 [Muribaculaceae bacterium]|nr:hypothetical protein [Muribaculaceae bacterium]
MTSLPQNHGGWCHAHTATHQVAILREAPILRRSLRYCEAIRLHPLHAANAYEGCTRYAHADRPEA